MITTRAVEIGANICAMIEFNGHRVMGSTLEAESAAVQMQLIANFAYGSSWKHYYRVNPKAVQIGDLDLTSWESW